MDGQLPESAPDSINAASASRRDWLVLSGIVVVYVALALRLLTLLPLWGAVHDEQLHFGYCKYLAVKGRLPVIGEGTSPDLRYYYDAPSAGDAAHHPPGYYFLGSLVYRIFGGDSLERQNYAIRGLSLVLNLFALVLLYLACRELLPDSWALAAAVTGLVAVFPHYLMISAVIYVESFGACATMGTLWMLARYAHRPQQGWLLTAAGVGTGLMALTKLTLLPFCAAVALCAAVLVWRSHRSWRPRILHFLGCVAAAAIVAGWWYVRNILLYGHLFATSDTQHPTSPMIIRIHGVPADMLTLLFIPMGQLYYKLAITGLFQYFWCPADWLPAGVRPEMYSVAAGTWILTAVGLFYGLRKRDADLTRLWAMPVLPFLVGTLLLVLFYIRWTVTTAIQAHAEFGKFAMPALGIFSLLFVLALQALWGRRTAVFLAAAFVLFFFAWDLMAIHNLAYVLIPAGAGRLLHP